MTAIVEIFTSPTCIYCPGAKKIVEEIANEQNITVFEHSASTEEGKKRALEFGIQSVPTILVSGPKTKEILAFRGIPNKEKFIEAIKTVA